MLTPGVLVGVKLVCAYVAQSVCACVGRVYVCVG